jgi:hypothetical protein
MSTPQTIPVELETALIQYAKNRVMRKFINGFDIEKDAVVKIVNPNAKPEDIRYQVSWSMDDNTRVNVDCIVKHPHCMSFMDMGIYIAGGSYALKRIG